MLPLPLIVVCALVGASILIAALVLVVKLRRSNPVTSNRTSLDAATPVRRLRVRRGRVVSFASTLRSAKDLTKWPMSRYSSRRSSWSSLPRTIDLEKDIEALKNDFYRDLEAQRPGSRNSRHGLYSITENEPPVPPLPAFAFDGKPVIACGSSLDPSDMIKESSWETYNGHRPADDVLSTHIERSPRSPKSPSFARRDLVDETLPNIPPPPTKSRSHGSLRRSAVETGMKTIRHSQPTPTASRANVDSKKRASNSSDARQQELCSVPTALASRELSPMATCPMSRQPEQPGVSPWAVSAGEEAMNLSHPRTMAPVAPKSHRPPRLDLQTNLPCALEYGFPSPPDSASMIISPISPPSAHRFSRFHTSTGSTPRVGRFPGPDFMDLESQTSAAPSPSQSRSRSLSRSRSASRSTKGRSRSGSHRVSKRPLPTLPAHLNQERTFYYSPSVSEPSLTPSKTPTSEKPSGKMKDHRLSAQTFQSGDLSPTFSVAPVFRVPLYAGKGSRGPQITVVDHGQSGRDVKSRCPEKTSNSKHPSVIHTLSIPSPEEVASAWPPSDIQSMLMRAHDMAQSMEPITPTTPNPKAAELPAQPVEPNHLASRQASSRSAHSKASQGRSLSGTIMLKKAHASSIPASKSSANTKDAREAPTTLRPTTPANGRSMSDNSMLIAARSRADPSINPPSFDLSIFGDGGKRGFTSSHTGHDSHLYDSKALPPIPPVLDLSEVKESHLQQQSVPSGAQVIEHPARRVALPNSIAASTTIQHQFRAQKEHRTSSLPQVLGTAPPLRTREVSRDNHRDRKRSSETVSAQSSPVGREDSETGFVSDLTSVSSSLGPELGYNL